MSLFWSGSSPLTRGKLTAVHPQARDHGLIPAHAGKTASSRTRANGSRAHPRSRGENLSLSATLFDEDGSSPLTRGKLQAPGRAQARGGLIPAHAGKTKSRRCLV